MNCRTEAKTTKKKADKTQEQQMLGTTKMHGNATMTIRLLNKNTY